MWTALDSAVKKVLCSFVGMTLFLLMVWPQPGIGQVTGMIFPCEKKYQSKASELKSILLRRTGYALVQQAFQAARGEVQNNDEVWVLLNKLRRQGHNLNLQEMLNFFYWAGSLSLLCPSDRKEPLSLDEILTGFPQLHQQVQVELKLRAEEEGKFLAEVREQAQLEDLGRKETELFSQLETGLRTLTDNLNAEVGKMRDDPSLFQVDEWKEEERRQRKEKLAEKLKKMPSEGILKDFGLFQKWEREIREGTETDPEKSMAEAVLSLSHHLQKRLQLRYQDLWSERERIKDQWMAKMIELERLLLKGMNQGIKLRTLEEELPRNPYINGEHLAQLRRILTERSRMPDAGISRQEKFDKIAELKNTLIQAENGHDLAISRILMAALGQGKDYLLSHASQKQVRQDQEKGRGKGRDIADQLKIMIKEMAFKGSSQLAKRCMDEGDGTKFYHFFQTLEKTIQREVGQGPYLMKFMHDQKGRRLARTCLEQYLEHKMAGEWIYLPRKQKLKLMQESPQCLQNVLNASHFLFNNLDDYLSLEDLEDNDQHTEKFRKLCRSSLEDKAIDFLSHLDQQDREMSGAYFVNCPEGMTGTLEEWKKRVLQDHEQARPKAGDRGDRHDQNSLTYMDTAAIGTYTGIHFLLINKGLRNGYDKIGGPVFYQQFEIMRALQKLPFHRGLVYRWANHLPQDFPVDRLPSEWKKGGPPIYMSDLAFLSSSLSPYVWNGDYQLKIHSLSGRHIEKYSANPAEKEVLFPPQTKFQFLKKENPSVFVLKEVIDPLQWRSYIHGGLTLDEVTEHLMEPEVGTK